MQVIIYHIQPARRIITEVSTMSNYLGRYFPEGSTMGGTLSTGDVVYVDDEFLKKPITKAFRLRSRKDGQPMLSDGIVSGRDRYSILHSDLVEASKPSARIRNVLDEIEWLTVEQALTWYQRNADAPAQVMYINGESTVISRWRDFLPVLMSK